MTCFFYYGCRWFMATSTIIPSEIFDHRILRVPRGSGLRLLKVLWATFLSKWPIAVVFLPQWSVILEGIIVPFDIIPSGALSETKSSVFPEFPEVSVMGVGVRSR